MMGGTKFSIREARPRADNGYRSMVIAHADADLFETAGRGERGNGIDDRAQSGQCHAGGHAHHVRLGYAAVEKSCFGFVLELVK